MRNIEKDFTYIKIVKDWTCSHWVKIGSDAVINQS